MRRFLAVLVLLLGAGAALATSGCGGGDKDFAFSGTWLSYHRVIASTDPDTPVGDTGVMRWTLRQDGTTITLTFDDAPEIPPLAGACDPDAGTFSIDLLGVIVIKGRATGDDEMEGTMTLVSRTDRLDTTWTAHRL